MNPQKLLPQLELATTPYVFGYWSISHEEQRFSSPQTWTIYVERGYCTLRINDTLYGSIDSGEVIHGCGSFDIFGDAEIFLVGVGSGSSDVILSGSSAKTVSKPWGKELWLTGERDDYCLKKIHINAGHQTSLQYHNRKVETNVLIKGEIELIGSDQYCEHLISPCYIHVLPPTVHRIRALADIILIEASTPDLDDVVRIRDDAGRGDGRIETEHK